MLSPTPDAMSRDEVRAGASLASIFALRMLDHFTAAPGNGSRPGGRERLRIGKAGEGGLPVEATVRIPSLGQLRFLLR